MTISQAFEESWAIVRKNFVLLGALTGVIMFGTAVLSKIAPWTLAITSILSAGFWRALWVFRKTGTFDYRDIFWPVMDVNRLLNFVAAFFISWFASLFGLILLVVPGVIAFVRLFFFTSLFVAGNEDGIAVLKGSWALTKGRFFESLLLILAFFGLLFLGTLCFFVGVLVTTPLAIFMVLIWTDANSRSIARPDQ